MLVSTGNLIVKFVGLILNPSGRLGYNQSQSNCLLQQKKKESIQRLFFPTSRALTNIIPARDPKQCCGVFLLEIVDAKSVSGSVHQNPVVLLLQGVFVRISASAASRATCARSLYAGLLSKIALSGSLRQDPVVGPLVQDHCMRISCARSLCHDVCIRIL